MRKLLFVLFLFSSVAFCLEKDETVDCIDGKIRYTENKKEVIVNDRYCFDTVLKSLSSTKKCLNGCIVDSLAPVIMKRSELHSTIDSPPYKMCRKAGGIPQEVDYWAQHKWIKTSRCLYNDGSYQDIERLISSRVKYED